MQLSPSPHFWLSLTSGRRAPLAIEYISSSHTSGLSCTCYNSLMFNVDGSAKGIPGMSGIGGVLRNARGSVLCLFSIFLGIFDAVLAELYAIHKAFQLVVSNPLLADRQIQIISDSNVVVSWINGEDFGNLKFVDLIYDIRLLLQSWDGLSVSYRSRDSNSTADSLAKLGSSGWSDRIEWGDI